MRRFSQPPAACKVIEDENGKPFLFHLTYRAHKPFDTSHEAWNDVFSNVYV